MARLWQFSEGHSKPGFSEKVQRETKRSFSKIAQKSSPPFKKANSTLAQMTLSSNKYALKVQGLEKILAQKAALKVPKWRSYGNFEKVTQNPQVQRGDEGKFFKNRPKSKPRLKGPKALWRKWHSTLRSMHF